MANRLENLKLRRRQPAPVEEVATAPVEAVTTGSIGDTGLDIQNQISSFDKEPTQELPTFDIKPTAGIDNAKVQRFVDRGKSQGKTEQEIKQAYQKALSDNFFAQKQEQEFDDGGAFKKAMQTEGTPKEEEPKGFLDKMAISMEKNKNKSKIEEPEQDLQGFDIGVKAGKAISETGAFLKPDFAQSKLEDSPEASAAKFFANLPGNTIELLGGVIGAVSDIKGTETAGKALVETGLNKILLRNTGIEDVFTSEETAEIGGAIQNELDRLGEPGRIKELLIENPADVLGTVLGGVSTVKNVAKAKGLTNLVGKLEKVEQALNPINIQKTIGKGTFEAVKKVGKEAVDIGVEGFDAVGELAGTKSSKLKAKADIQEKQQAEDIANTKLSEMSETERGESGRLVPDEKGKPIVIRDDAEIQGIEEVDRLIKEGKLNIDDNNLNQRQSIQSEIETMATDLESKLDIVDVRITKDEVLSFMKGLTKQALNEPAIVGSSPATIKKLLKAFLPKIKQVDYTPKELLGLRKEFYKMIENAKGKRALETDLDTAFTKTRKIFGQGLNNKIQDLAPDVPALDSLRKQSALYDVESVISSRVAKDPIGLLDAIGKVLSPVAKAGALGSLVGLTGAKIALLTGGIAGIKPLVKFLTSSNFKRSRAKLWDMLDNRVKENPKTKPQADAIKDVTSDRAIDWLKVDKNLKNIKDMQDFMEKVGTPSIQNKLPVGKRISPKDVEKGVISESKKGLKGITIPTGTPTKGIESTTKETLALPQGKRITPQDVKKGVISESMKNIKKSIRPGSDKIEITKMLTQAIDEANTPGQLEELKDFMEGLDISDTVRDKINRIADDRIAGFNDMIDEASISARQAVEEQFTPDLLKAFNKLAGDEKRTKKTTTGDKFSKVETLTTPNATKFKDAVAEFVESRGDDRSVQEIFDDLKDIAPEIKSKPKPKKKPKLDGLKKKRAPINNKGFIDLGAIKKSIVGEKIPKSLEGLAKEAKKFKTADEFDSFFDKGIDVGLENSTFKLESVNINDISPTQTLVRQGDIFNKVDVEDMMTEIKQGTVLPPILIDKNGFIRDGHRRFEALTNLGVKDIPSLRIIGDGEGVIINLDDFYRQTKKKPKLDGLKKKSIVGEKVKLPSGNLDDIKPIKELNTGEEMTLVRGTGGVGSGAGESIRGKGLYLTDNIDVAKHYGENLKTVKIKNSDILDGEAELKDFKNIINKLPKEMQRFLDDTSGYTYNQLVRDIEGNTGIGAEEIAEAINSIIKKDYKGIKFNIGLVNDRLLNSGLGNENAFVFF